MEDIDEQMLDRADWERDLAKEERHMGGRHQPEEGADSQPHAVRYITLDPNYENTALWFAAALRDHSFDKHVKEPIISFIEQIRYLTQTDLPAVARIIEKLR